MEEGSRANIVSKVQAMRSKNNGSYLFFEENEERQKVYYSLVDKSGETVRKGEMTISIENFVDYMQRIGFKYPEGGESF